MTALKEFTPRLYQETIFATCTLKNCLVVLPTGLGKTGIALMLTAHRLNQYPNSKIVFLAPTKPLAEQHLKTFKNHLKIEEEKFSLFTGDMAPEERQKKWPEVQIIFGTPQGFENDVISNKTPLEEVSLLILDEAHHAVGDYSYVFLTEQYIKKAKYPRILGLTASPGAEIEHIEEVCKNLYIEDVEIRTTEDRDVSPYVQDINIDWTKVELTPELENIRKFLLDCFKQKIEKLKTMGLNSGKLLSKKDLLILQKDIQARMATGERDFETLKSLSVIAEAVKIQHALELLETQGLAQLVKYFEKLQNEANTSKSKAVKNLVQDINYKSAVIKTQNLFEQNIEHPKITKLKEIVEKEIEKNKFVKIILFTQYRDSAVRIKQEIEKIKNVVPTIFVGQAKKGETGLTQKQQAEMLQQFKDGLFNVLIATSVAEEGLDIPAVDLVIFYEPIPSAIRMIQRRGRTGRQEKGRVIILMTKGTRDEAFHWAAQRKEKNMHKFLNEMRTTMKHKLMLTLNNPVNKTKVNKDSFEYNENKQTNHSYLASKQSTIPTYTKQNITIFADYREKTSGIVKELINLGTNIKLEMLESADYLLSSKVGVEFKTTEDFVASIIDGRLLEQLKNLKQNFAKPIIIIEGTQNMFAIRNIHPNAIRGMLATIATSYGIPILQTTDPKDTAGLLFAIAKREQEKETFEYNPHTSKKPMSTQEAQEYVISAFPNIGGQLAKELLKKLKTIKNIVNATEEELQKIEGMGEKKAKTIEEISEREY